jgi:hypothetical protein
MNIVAAGAYGTPSVCAPAHMKYKINVNRNQKNFSWI